MLLTCLFVFSSEFIHCIAFLALYFQFALDSFEKKYTSLELEYINAQKGQDETIEKLRGFEQKCSQLEQNVKRCLFCFLLSPFLQK
jgi:hypothetical protein